MVGNGNASTSFSSITRLVTGTLHKLTREFTTLTAKRRPSAAAARAVYCSRPELTRCEVRVSTSNAHNHGPAPFWSCATNRTVRSSIGVGYAISVLRRVSCSGCPPSGEMRHRSISRVAGRPGQSRSSAHPSTRPDSGCAIRACFSRFDVHWRRCDPPQMWGRLVPTCDIPAGCHRATRQPRQRVRPKNCAGAPLISGNSLSLRPSDSGAPYLRSIARESDRTKGPAHISQPTLGQVSETAAVGLNQPDVERAAPVGDEGDEFPVRGDGRVGFGSFEVGDPREMRIGKRILDCGRDRLARDHTT